MDPISVHHGLQSRATTSSLGSRTLSTVRWCGGATATARVVHYLSCCRWCAVQRRSGRVARRVPHPLRRGPHTRRSRRGGRATHVLPGWPRLQRPRLVGQLSPVHLQRSAYGVAADAAQWFTRRSLRSALSGDAVSTKAKPTAVVTPNWARARSREHYRPNSRKRSLMATISKYQTASGATLYRVRYRTPDNRQTDKRGFTTKRDAEKFASRFRSSSPRLRC